MSSFEQDVTKVCKYSLVFLLNTFDPNFHCFFHEPVLLNYGTTRNEPKLHRTIQSDTKHGKQHRAEQPFFVPFSYCPRGLEWKTNENGGATKNIYMYFLTSDRLF